MSLIVYVVCFEPDNASLWDTTQHTDDYKRNVLRSAKTIWKANKDETFQQVFYSV